MLQGVNLEEIKQYNASLKQYKDKAAALNAEIEYTNKEINSVCAELTAELGVTVTRDNIEQIFNEQVSKINSTLQSGNAVLAKIASEEAASNPMNNTAQSVPVQPVPSVPVQPVPPTAPAMTPTYTQPSNMTQPAQSFESQQTSGSVFGTVQPSSSQLPPLFKI
jgi:prefoldin subunit 5